MRDGWYVTEGRDVAHWFRHGDGPLSDDRGWPINPLCGITDNASRWTPAPNDWWLTWRFCRTCHRRLGARQVAERRSRAADALIRSTGCLPPVEASQ